MSSSLYRLMQNDGPSDHDIAAILEEYLGDMDGEESGSQQERLRDALVPSSII